MDIRKNVIMAEAHRTALEIDPSGMVAAELLCLLREREDLLTTLGLVREQSAAAHRVAQKYQTTSVALEGKFDAIAAELYELRQVNRAFSRARSVAVQMQTQWMNWQEKDGAEPVHDIAQMFLEILRFLGVRLPNPERLGFVGQDLPSDVPTDVNAAHAAPSADVGVSDFVDAAGITE